MAGAEWVRRREGGVEGKKRAGQIVRAALGIKGRTWTSTSVIRSPRELWAEEQDLTGVFTGAL